MEISNELKKIIKNEFERMKHRQSRAEKEKEAHKKDKDNKRKGIENEVNRIIETLQKEAELKYSLLKNHKGIKYTEEEYLGYMEHLSSPEFARDVRNYLLNKNIDPTREGKGNPDFNWWAYDVYELIKQDNSSNRNADIYRWMSNFLQEHHIFYTPETLKQIIYKYKKKAKSKPYKSLLNYFSQGR